MSFSAVKLTQFLFKNKENWSGYYSPEPDYPFERYAFLIDTFICALHLGITENGYVIVISDFSDIGWRRKKDYRELVTLFKDLGEEEPTSILESKFSLDDWSKDLRKRLSRKDRKLDFGKMTWWLFGLTEEEFHSFRKKMSFENSIFKN